MQIEATGVIERLEGIHPRAMKLMLKGKNFVVVAEDEPYFVTVYGLIRKHEMDKGTWTAQDEGLYTESMKRLGKV